MEKGRPPPLYSILRPSRRISKTILWTFRCYINPEARAKGGGDELGDMLFTRRQVGPLIIAPLLQRKDGVQLGELQKFASLIIEQAGNFIFADSFVDLMLGNC